MPRDYTVLEQQYREQTVEQRLRSHGAISPTFLGDYVHPQSVYTHNTSWICNCCGSRLIDTEGHLLYYRGREHFREDINYLDPEKSWLEDADNSGFFNCRYYYAITDKEEEAREVPLFKNMSDVQYLELVSDDRVITIAYKEEEKASEYY